jgi:hypothetical protein
MSEIDSCYDDCKETRSLLLLSKEMDEESCSDNFFDSDEEDALIQEQFLQDNPPPAQEQQQVQEQDEASGAQEEYHHQNEDTPMMTIVETAESTESHNPMLLETSGSSTIINQAWSLWANVIELQVNIANKHPVAQHSLQAYNETDMVLLAASFACQREEFRKLGKPTQVDIGYHYTRSGNMHSITRGGLLTYPERQENGVHAHYNGSAHGDGIYTCDDNSTTKNYGNVGLIVALVGPHVVDHDTYVAGKYAVLRKSAQCLVLMRFDTKLLNQEGGPDALKAAHEALKRLVDRRFNSSG